jgi:hypothetical protein
MPRAVVSMSPVRLLLPFHQVLGSALRCLVCERLEALRAECRPFAPVRLHNCESFVAAKLAILCDGMVLRRELFGSCLRSIHGYIETLIEVDGEESGHLKKSPGRSSRWQSFMTFAVRESRVRVASAWKATSHSLDFASDLHTDSEQASAAVH